MICAGSRPAGGMPEEGKGAMRSMVTIKLDANTIAQIDELILRYHKEFGDDYSREFIIEKALTALEEITDGW